MDTKAEIKKLLKEYPDLKRQILKENQRLSHIARLKEAYPDTLKAAAPRKANIQRTEVSDPIFSLITRYDDEIDELTEKINDLIDRQKTVERMLYILEPFERRIIELRYIDNPSYRCDIWAWIGDKTCYSRRQVLNIFDQAIGKMVNWHYK